MTHLQMTKNEISNIVIVGSTIILVGVLIMYFLSNSAFSQIPYLPKYSNSNSNSNTNKNDNSGVIWPNRNTTATNQITPDNGIYKKSMTTKNATSAHKTTSS